MVKIISDSEFENEVLKHEGLVVVDFYADWCGPCKMIAPVLETLATQMLGKVKICKINVDENQEIPSKFGIRSIPTLIAFKNGSHIETKVGGMPKPQLEQWLTNLSGNS
jgi:thioredoxin 1